MPIGTPSGDAMDTATAAMRALVTNVRGFANSGGGVTTMTDDVVDDGVLAALRALDLADVRFVRAAATTLLAFCAEVVAEKDPSGGLQHARTTDDRRVQHTIELHPGGPAQ